MRKKTNAANHPDRLNVIVEGTSVTGNIITESNLRIDGIIDGNIDCKAKLVLGPTGKIKGRIKCNEADLEGVIHGPVTVEEKLTLRKTANVVGEIITQKIEIEEGAQFSGQCKMSNTTNKVQTEELVY